jgi:nifR3 family TIM-barrel protein
MEDVTNIAMRRIAKVIGRPGLVFTEFVSAMAVHHNPARALPKMRIHPLERPLAVQIFGGEPETMAESARHAEAMGADIVDINMGCWVPKVCRTGAGAALLKDPEVAERIVQAVVNAVCVPVTVKVRAGWDYSLFAAPELARRFQGAGVKAMTLHARFARQGFEGRADWRLIADLREVLQIPLIGNGDIKTPEDARRMLERTGADAAMVGRAAISNPWALAEIRAALEGEPAPPPPTLDDRIETALRHLRLFIAFEAGVDEWEQAVSTPDFAGAELRACRALRGQIPLYIKGLPGAATLRGRLTACSRYAEYETILREFQRSSESRSHVLAGFA